MGEKQSDSLEFSNNVYLVVINKQEKLGAQRRPWTGIKANHFNRRE